MVPISDARLARAVPQFTVPDVVRTATHYRDSLGFEIRGYWDGESVHDDPGRVALFGIVERDGVTLHFNRADESPVRTGRAAGAYDVYIQVNAVDKLAEELRRRGAEILEGPEDKVYGQRELIVRDCNGLVLAFAEAVSSRAT